MKPNILVVIPARGGSKGIPRKNLRSLAGKPLLYYIANTLKLSKYDLDLYLSSDDTEILSLGTKLGLKSHFRSSVIAADDTTLDPVIYNCLEYAENIEAKEYDLVITAQPTSPLLKSTSIDDGIDIILKNDSLDTVISVKDSTALSWTIEDGKSKPLYKERVNRQYLKPSYTETGGFLICRRNIVTPSSRIGSNVELFLLGEDEGIDIDTFQDWAICEYLLNRKKILFVVSGNNKIGLGHVYNTLILANDLVMHEICFLVTAGSTLAEKVISDNNYQVTYQSSHSIIEDVNKIAPDVVINDCLDTSKTYIRLLKKCGYKVINFEDLGEGSKEADLVVNAIYPEKTPQPNHFYGPQYFLLRDEFLLTPSVEIKSQVNRVLITFGGVDPLNNTYKVVDAIHEYCQERNITIQIIAGLGYDNYQSLEPYEHIEILHNVKNISDYMVQADIIFTSAGRTIYEIASLKVPTIVLAQNKRELTHYFASQENGFINLGLGSSVTSKEILDTFTMLSSDYQLRCENSLLMGRIDFKSGRHRVVSLIKEEIQSK